MMKRLGLVPFMLLWAVAVGAQVNFTDVLEKDVEGEGEVRVECDERLDSLIGYCMPDIEGEQIKAIGYRIQVFAGNNTRDARAKAQEAETYIRENFPELPVYTLFKSPRWLCTVGDFLYYEEAYDVLRKIRKDSPYKGMIILRNQEINVSL